MIPLIRVGRFNFEPRSIPEEFHERAAKQLNLVERLIPNWCRDVHIDYRDLGNSSAEISARYDYRRAFLTLSSIFFHERHRQTRVLVHEICHIIQEPLWNVTVDIRNRLGETAPGWTEYLTEQMRHAREQAVCDMTELFMNEFAEEDER